MLTAIFLVVGHCFFASLEGREEVLYMKRTLVQKLGLLVFGLMVCCFAAARDGLDKTIQSTIDGSCAPGLFPLVSIPTVVGCIGAALILVAAIATPIAKSQRAREIWFYIMSGCTVLKIVTVEIARMLEMD